MGGNPPPIAWPEVYTSLAISVVKSTRNDITLDGHAYMGGLCWMNQDFWDGLAESEKRVVYDAFQHLKTVPSPVRCTRGLPTSMAMNG